jgi:ribosome-binding factor A
VSSSSRRERIGALIKEVLADIIATDLRDPRVGFVTVTGVAVTNDYSVARVRVSVMGSEEEKTESLAGLQRASGYLRSALAAEVEMRSVPELRFELDRGLEHMNRINEILDGLDQAESPS